MPLYEGLGYGGEKTVVIFDFGAAYTKCGFAGENGPRCIIPSQVKKSKTGPVVKIHSVCDADELYAVLRDFINILYFRHLLINPKERRVVVVESVMTTSHFRECLAKVLFKHYEVPSVLFAPSHLVALFTLGVPSGLVMDVGYTETVVLPVCEGIPLIKAWQAIPVAAKSIHDYLEAQLLETATVKEGQGEARPLSSGGDILDEKILEDIKVRCCFVTKMDRAQQIQAANRGEPDAKVPAPPPDVDYPLDGSKIMHVPGKIRENACEVLFEHDRDEMTIATLILDSLLKCPIDMRRMLAENLVVMGGTAMLPGFRHRLLLELRALLEKPKYQHQLSLPSLKFHDPPAKANYVAWLGGAVFGALEVLASRSVSREQYQQTATVPDWCAVFDTEEKDERSQFLKREVSKDVAITTATDVAVTTTKDVAMTTGKNGGEAASGTKKSVEFSPAVTYSSKK